MLTRNFGLTCLTESLIISLMVPGPGTMLIVFEVKTINDVQFSWETSPWLYFVRDLSDCFQRGFTDDVWVTPTRHQEQYGRVCSPFYHLTLKEEKELIVFNRTINGLGERKRGLVCWSSVKVTRDFNPLQCTDSGPVTLHMSSPFTMKVPPGVIS